ncbi:MAG: hypothetical protein AAGA99_12160 [Actinomycetota bacterium]
MIDHLPDAASAGRAIGVAAFGLAGRQLGAVLSQAEPDAVTPWVTGGSSALIAAALVYIARLFATGAIVAVNSNERERRLERVVEKQERTIADLVELTRESHNREDRLIELFSQTRLTNPKENPHGT